MLVAFGRRISLIVLVNIVSCVLCLRQYGTPGDTLYVAGEEQNNDKLTIINRSSENDEYSHLERRKRDAVPSSTPTPATQNKNISTWVTIYFLVKSNNIDPFVVLILVPGSGRILPYVMFIYRALSIFIVAVTSYFFCIDFKEHFVL